MSGHVTVRMYNMGFGDAFLLTFPGPDRPRKVLIDCGYHAAGPGPNKLKDVVARIIEDVQEDGEPVIDVVIATHRHRDHVYGFEQKAWEKVKVSEVWMPWTEHRTNPEAVRIRTRQAKKALRLVKAFGKMKLSKAKKRELLDMVENSAEWKNAKAMNTLHNGFADVKRRRFLPTRGNRAELKPRRLPGVKVHVLGPSRKESVIREMEPPEDESFLRLGLDRSARPGAPFEPGSVLNRGKEFHRWLKDMLAMPKLPRVVRPRSHEPEFASWWIRTSKLKERQFKLAESSIEDDPMLAAVALDRAVNGTSLMLVFEIGRAFLLFPGDAQYGTWEAAMEHPASREILEKTTFLKVGHHGSHNATPKSFIDDVLPSKFLGMVPTRETTRYPEIPRKPLLKALRKKAKKIVRADAGTVPSPFKRVDGFAIETKVPI